MGITKQRIKKIEKEIGEIKNEDEKFILTKFLSGDPKQEALALKILDKHKNNL